MKKRNILLTTVLFTVILFTGCASKQKIKKERSENFIADIDQFSIGEFHLYTRMTISAPKISDFSFSFIPRTNNIAIRTKITPDYVQLFFSYAERQKLKKAAEEYLDNYNNGLIKNEKPTKKNAFYTSNIPCSWGMLGYSHDIQVTYSTNIEYLEPDKPYFRLKFNSITDPEDGSTSPAFSIYISPAQWRTIFEMCNQEILVSKVDEILQEADVW